MKDKDLIDAAADLATHLISEEALQLEYNTQPLPHVTTAEVRTGGDRTIRPVGEAAETSAGQVGVEISVGL